MGERITQLAICGLCGSSCLIDATVENGQIVEVQKATGHPHVKGKLCVRGAALKQYIHHKDRLQYPMKRTGPKGTHQFERITWEEAYKIIADRLTATKAESGAKSTIFYCGHPKWYRQFYAELAAQYGSPNFCTESSTCRQAAQMCWELVYGGSFATDFKECATLLVWTKNNAYSEAGDMGGIATVKERGANIIVVDPRITPTTNMATIHLQLIPGTDGALALGIANVIISEGLEDKEFIEKYTFGYEEYKAYAAQFTPEKTEEITGVPKEKIIAAARMIATAGPCSLMTSSCSVVHCTNGVQNFRAVLMLSALTGNFDRPGGNHASDAPRAMLNTSPHNLVMRPDIDDDITNDMFPVWRDVINNESQSIRLADNILNSDPYPIRNLISFGMNAQMWPRPDRIIEALKAVEFSVAVELFWNESCEYADVVLPCTAACERDEVLSLPGNWIRFIPKLLDPEEKKSDVEIIMGIANALGLEGKMISMKSHDDYLNYILAPTGLTLDELKAEPDGVKAKKTVTGSLYNYETGLKTPSGKVEFVSNVIARYADRPYYDPLPVYHDWRDTVGDREKYPMVLVTGGRKPQLFHSRTYRMKWISNLEPHTVAVIGIKDAERLDVKDGDAVTVETPVGKLDYMVSIDSGVLPGVVHIVHDDGEQNVNLLMEDTYIDPISGFPGFRSFICNIHKCDTTE